MGKRRNGGHELSETEAVAILAGIEGQASSETPTISKIRAMSAGDASAASAEDVTFVAGDAPWQRELRRRQSAWRVARGYPIGLNGKGRPLGSRLAMPEAEQHLWNFLTPAIGQLVRREHSANAGAAPAHRKLFAYPRLFNDLLSSQPLVFNLFGELAAGADLERATAVARCLWPGRVDDVTRVEFEWSPGRRDPRYLNNGTAADVAFFHTIPGGGRGIIFVETKYHENLRGKDYQIKSRYEEVALQSGAFLRESLPRLRAGSLQQLWFDHLLVLATRQTDGLDGALFVVVYPDINERCRDAVAAYRQTLDPGVASTFEGRTLEDVFRAMQPSVDPPWAAAFRERYLTPST